MPNSTDKRSTASMLDRSAAVKKICFAGLLTLLFDSALRGKGRFDYGLIELIRSIQFPSDEWAIERLRLITGLEATTAVWLAALALTLLLKKWARAVALVGVPIAYLCGWAVEHLWLHAEIDPSRVSGLATNQPAEITSMGSLAAVVVLGGVLFTFAAALSSRLARSPIQVLCLVVVLAAGLARVWSGSLWATDMLSAYLVGTSVLAVFLERSRRAQPYLKNAPFIGARRMPHVAGKPHAHALTSLIHFRGDRVWKVYSPGFLPQAIYWLAFQAPFPYAHNPAALSAAVHRRNLAGALTEYWYGDRRVARMLRIDDVDGRPALVGEFIDGEEPSGDAARPFLEDLVQNFERAGFPTWQIDPRQPRSSGNLIETPDGRMVVIDLESGLVSPLASVGAWVRALRRRVVPIFDDVYFDVTREYIAGESEAMRERMGAEWFEDLEHELDLAEQNTIAWHASEPRIWSLMLGWLYTGFRIRTWRGRLRRRMEDGRESATEWLESAIERWETEGRLNATEAREMRAEVESAAFQAVLPHFGVHMALSVVLRFPFGSMARFAYTAGSLAVASSLLVTRKSTRKQWKEALSIHSPLVMIVSALPGFGAFAYFTSKPVRSQGTLGRVALDAAGEKVPLQLYRRSGAQRLVAGRPAGKAKPADPKARPTYVGN